MEYPVGSIFGASPQSLLFVYNPRARLVTTLHLSTPVLSARCFGMFSWSLTLLFSVLTFSTGIFEVSANLHAGRTIDVLKRSKKTWTLESFRDYVVGVHMKYNKTIALDKRASGTDL